MEHFWGDVIETLNEKKEVTDGMKQNRNQAAKLTDLSQQIIASQQSTIGVKDTSKELSESIGLTIEAIQSAIQERGEKLKKIYTELEKKKGLLEKSIEQREQDLQKIHQLSLEIKVSLTEIEQQIRIEIQEFKNKLKMVNEALLNHDPEKVLQALKVN